ncbi:MAG: ABC transporter ATP-binding protein [Candidatus Aureabacteria bacterium]|nr:ABC transporter ATP-binding protein [Candidatus Auribacterota bacterium]
MGSALLEVIELRTRYSTDAGAIAAVDGVSFSINAGETLGLVGESACGKSAVALSIMRLIDHRQGAVAGGRIMWRGRDLLSLDEGALRRIRGAEIAMVFQDPFASLNPVFNIGTQIAEAVRLHQGARRGEALREAEEALARVHIPSPGVCVREYPHQMSGGMQQRAMIAMALSCGPELLIADEPTTALDVTIQAQILELLREIQSSTGMALLLISHDLGVISRMAGRVAMMYAGKIVEEGPSGELLRAPRHPYTEALLDSMPRLGTRSRRLTAIKGSVPDPINYPAGCRFAPRCRMAEERCRREEPLLRRMGERRTTACHFAERLAERHMKG